MAISLEERVNHNPPSTRCRDRLPNAVLKRDATDFQVIENLGFEPDGEGEHLWLQVRKTDCNTQDLIDALSGNLKVQAKNIGYSGMKDKRAVTTQWLSAVYPIANGMPQQDALFAGLENVEVLQLNRSGKKLRRGVHRSNTFIIRLYDIDSGRTEIDHQLDVISKQGFPNYFGEQRFGIDGRNVDHARSMFSRKRKLTRLKRSLYLSAARSWLFNKVLDARIDAGMWQQVIPGDVCMLAGSNSIFTCDQPDEEIQQRYNIQDIHITGPLYGRGESMATAQAFALESSCLATEQLLCDGLEQAGLKNERRALRATASELNWNWPDENTLELSFTLDRGVYATSLLCEIVQAQQEYKK